MACYRANGFEFCHITAVERTAAYRTLQPAQSFVVLSDLIKHIRILLKVTADSSGGVKREMMHAGLLSDPVIATGMKMLFKDSLRLFVCMNDIVVNILERFTKMPKTQAEIALKLYRESVESCKCLDDFIKTCKTIKCTDGENIPDQLSKAPESLIPTLESYLSNYGSRMVPQIRSADGSSASQAPVDPALSAAVAKLQVQAVSATSLDPKEQAALVTANPANPFLSQC